MAPSSSKFCPQVAHKRFATLEWHFLRLNFTVRVAHKKGCATSGNKMSATVLHRMYDQISKSPLTRLASKVQTQGPEDQDEGPEDQGTRGPRDQRTKGPEGPRDQGTKGPEDQGTKRPGNQQTRTKGVGGILCLIRINGFSPGRPGTSTTTPARMNITSHVSTIAAPAPRFANAIVFAELNGPCAGGVLVCPALSQQKFSWRSKRPFSFTSAVW